ncbi:hypothetical protein RYX36_009072 [Vicia faba]
MRICWTSLFDEGGMLCVIDEDEGERGGASRLKRRYYMDWFVVQLAEMTEMFDELQNLEDTMEVEAWRMAADWVVNDVVVSSKDYFWKQGRKRIGLQFVSGDYR